MWVLSRGTICVLVVLEPLRVQIGLTLPILCPGPGSNYVWSAVSRKSTRNPMFVLALVRPLSFGVKFLFDARRAIDRDSLADPNRNFSSDRFSAWIEIQYVCVCVQFLSIQCWVLDRDSVGLLTDKITRIGMGLEFFPVP